MTTPDPSHADWEILSLSQCTALRNVTLVLEEATFSRWASVEAGDSLLHVLSHLPKHIPTIIFQIGRWPSCCVSTAECLMKPEFAPFWEKLNVSLSKMTSLSKIEFWFVIRKEESNASWTVPVKNHLSSYFEKGLVTIGCRYDLAPRWAKKD